MKYGLIILFCFLGLTAFTQSAQDTLIQDLVNTIHQSDEYDKNKIEVIDQLRTKLQNTSPGSLQVIFETTEKIYEEYKVFKYDSAYLYANKLLEIARQTGNGNNLAAAKMKISFILLSTGLYKETYDSLQNISADLITDTLKKAEYYTLWARYYYDVAAYANDNYHSADYDSAGSVYLDSAILYYPAGSFERTYYTGLRYFKQNKRDSAYSYFSSLLQQSHLSYHQYALAASTLSNIYQQHGDINKTIELLVKATEADIRSSTKETLANFHLAELLYKIGDLKTAAICIENAVANAAFYGARQRKVQTNSILPLIEGERINSIEEQKRNLIKYASVVTILGLLLAVLIYIVFKQYKNLKIAQQLLSLSHEQQQVINKQLEHTNKELENANKQLEEANEKQEEANKIKEEYIAYFFNTDSQLYAKLDKIKSTLLRKIKERNYDEARFFVDKIDPEKEKKELLQNFDKLFLKLFPHFVDEVNALLHPEAAIKLKENELLNTDLRIFALIRMGVTDTEQIARILDYSVKTIYAYKTKLKHKSLTPNENFDDKIMKIRAL
ncbi:DUF6377 domain-containing protein [Ferruginibacter albus]|uniref:DUF6377 domain-containing protein n=1 Tax=Ferruginibacter albus TaxID=2875540 RepID=UPI001CC347E6|nr:DUF6377 domain-containing protein [Ferruginibacter albus]UAY51875.1 DUF6377 domain-containing protein [Ferruginibacter albus]